MYQIALNERQMELLLLAVAFASSNVDDIIDLHRSEETSDTEIDSYVDIESRTYGGGSVMLDPLPDYNELGKLLEVLNKQARTKWPASL